MTSYNWYFIFNSNEFNELGLISRTYSLDLGDTGEMTDILVTKGNYFGITYNGVFLPLELNDKNPFEFDGFAIAVHENRNVFLGIAIED